MRQIVLDTETTGLDTEQGHRIIEIGGVELLGRRLTGNHFHRYLNPERAIDEGAQNVHGISEDFLADKPLFRDVVEEFLAFIDGAELIIHNAPFDITFLDYELSLLDGPLRRMTDHCRVIDSLELARNKHPGQRNNLDALCRRYEIDNSSRVLHGALLDAEILADVYLMMTGGQTALFGGDADSGGNGSVEADRPLSAERAPLKVVLASLDEAAAHEAYLEMLEQQSGVAVWRQQPA